MPAVSKRAKANVKKGKKAWYQWYKDAIICPRCRERKPEPGYTLCQTCLKAEKARRKDDRRDYYKTRRDGFIAAGMCDICGKRPSMEGIKSCQRCRERRRDSRIKYKIHQRTLREAGK